MTDTANEDTGKAEVTMVAKHLVLKAQTEIMIARLTCLLFGHEPRPLYRKAASPPGAWSQGWYTILPDDTRVLTACARCGAVSADPPEKTVPAGEDGTRQERHPEGSDMSDDPFPFRCCGNCEYAKCGADPIRCIYPHGAHDFSTWPSLRDKEKWQRPTREFASCPRWKKFKMPEIKE